jgi:hypothetical protein
MACPAVTGITSTPSLPVRVRMIAGALRLSKVIVYGPAGRSAFPQ